MKMPAGKKLRLTRRADIKRLFDQGRHVADRRLTLFGSPTPGPGGPGPARVGVAVSVKHGNAVRRNRIKRRCREAFRLVRPRIPPGWDFMVVPRAGAVPEVVALQESLVNLAARLAASAQKDSL